MPIVYTRAPPLPAMTQVGRRASSWRRTQLLWNDGPIMSSSQRPTEPMSRPPSEDGHSPVTLVAKLEGRELARVTFQDGPIFAGSDAGVPE